MLTTSTRKSGYEKLKAKHYKLSFAYINTLNLKLTERLKQPVSNNKIQLTIDKVAHRN
ncbi:hypothetical protein VCR12J2_600012 [Vibrio coralliirubri]|nr:hypothetical protein VCR12J2_600012 [Vibrio coralliirubri]